MRIATISILLALVFGSSALAEEYQLRSRFNDLNKGDGFMEEGSYSNPYELRSSAGETVGTIRPRFNDLIPGDGFMESGSYSNPLVLKTDR